MRVQSNGRDEILNTVLSWQWRSKGFDAQCQQTQMANPHWMYDIKKSQLFTEFPVICLRNLKLVDRRQ
jgi:hypothetical protein